MCIHMCMYIMHVYEGRLSSACIGDGIYISCKPTGSSNEEEPVEYSKNTTSNDYSTIFEIILANLSHLLISSL